MCPETGENNPAPVDITVASPEPNMFTQPVDGMESKHTCQVERQVHEVSQETMSSVPSSAVNVSDQDRAKPPNSSRISGDHGQRVSEAEIVSRVPGEGQCQGRDHQDQSYESGGTCNG